MGGGRYSRWAQYFFMNLKVRKSKKEASTMNRIFKVIYSKTKHTYVVASELAKSHGKSKNGGVTSTGLLPGVLLAALLLTGGSFGGVSSAADTSDENAYHAGWGITIADETKTDDKGNKTTTKNVISVNRNLSNDADPDKASYKVDGENAMIIGGGSGDLEYADDSERELITKIGAHGKNSLIAGGFDNATTGEYTFTAGGALNTASEEYASVFGGEENEVSGSGASVFGGYQNIASGDLASVFGGWKNTASEELASVFGGAENTAYGDGATVVGGHKNTAGGFRTSLDTVIGGQNNTAGGEGSFISGGQYNVANDYGNIVGGSYNIAATTHADEIMPV